MKEVIYGNELKNTIIEATNIICDTVSSTLGPKGNNVLVNSSDSIPYITNDGVSIAEVIESNNEKINTVLEILKESALKTNEVVGDGTTTTLVLLKSILLSSLNVDKNKMELKKELLEAMDIVINLLNSIAKKPKRKDYLNIASISANDKNIGSLLTEVFLKMKNKYAIKLEPSNNNKDYYEIKKGYTIEVDDISSLYFNKNDTFQFKNAYILLFNDYLEDIEQINTIINDAIENNKNVIIFATDFSDIVKNQILTYYLEYNKNIFLFKISEYGSRQYDILEDIQYITNATIINSNSNINGCNILGNVDTLIINKNEINLVGGNEENIHTRLIELKKKLKVCNSEYEKNFLEVRIAKLEKGIATIYVSGITKTEAKEKMMRFEDALCALEVTKNGILPGEGISFLFAKDHLDSNTTGKKIIKKSLEIPFDTIFKNAGIENAEIKSEITNSNYRKIYNFETNELIDTSLNLIIDPKDVIISAFKNSVSIAIMLITTNYLVINEKNMIKDNEI